MENKLIFETGYLRLAVAPDGGILAFTEKATGRNVLADGPNWFSRITLDDGGELLPIHLDYVAPFLTIDFDKGLTAVVRVAEHSHYLTFALESVSRPDFHAIAFVQIKVGLDYRQDHTFIASCLAMSLNTRMQEYPGRNNLLLGEAFTHIGLQGAKCALIGAPERDLNAIMKEVLDEIPDGAMPKGAYSGPYAPDCPDATRTYTIGGAATADDVDEYVRGMKQFGISQVHMHQGDLYRQSDFQVSSPNGPAGLRRIMKRYHELDIQVMLHTYTFFIDEWDKPVGNRYIAPVPHRDLGVCARFTLDHDIDSEAVAIPVTEPTTGLREVFGYHEPAAPILWIDDELIRFKSISKNGLYGFAGCERGALGTIAACHKQDSQVRQLNSYFGYLAPEKNSALFYEIARNTADFYNEFDFDGFYLDAIDGVFVLDGIEFSWYHAVVFINELFKNLKKPPIFNCCYGPQYPGQWFARTRMGAFDSASRGYRDYTDAHVAFNEQYAERMYLIGELGWWSLFPAVNDQLGWQNKIMFDEDVDYICAKVLATDACHCWHGSFIHYKEIPMLASYRDKIMLYTRLKKADYFSGSVKKQVRRLATEFDLVQTAAGDYRFRRSHTDRQRLESLAEGRNTWTAVNRFAAQRPKIRIEALYSAGLYDNPDAQVILDLDEQAPLKLNQTYPVGHLDLNDRRGLGVWFNGDGQGETVNIRLRSPQHVARGQADHFIKVDFTGWRYFAFYEFQNCEMPHDDWAPKQMDYQVYTDVESFYAAYTSPVDFGDIAFIDLLVNRDGDYDVRMKPIVAVPHQEITLADPSLAVGNQRITFKTLLKSNTFLEYSPEDGACVVRDLTGRILDTPDMDGDAPILAAGPNVLALTAGCAPLCPARAVVTLRTAGELVQ